MVSRALPVWVWGSTLASTDLPCNRASPLPVPSLASSLVEMAVVEVKTRREVLSCLLFLYTAVMSFEILFPFVLQFGLWVFEPGWLLDHSQLV